MYLILSTSRLAFGTRVRPSDVSALLNKYSPTSILPGDWSARPVARLGHAFFAKSPF